MFLNLKKLIYTMFIFSALSLTLGCDPVKEEEREFTTNEAVVMSKQWCASAQIAFGTPVGVVPSLVKLDLTQPGYIYVTALTRSTFVNPPQRQQNVLNCSLTSQENVMECYGLGVVKFTLDDTKQTLKTDLLEEVKTFKECERDQLALF